MDLPALALACGYRTAVTLKSQDEVVEYFCVNSAGGGPRLVEIMVNKFSRADLSRPDSTPIQNKTRFMQKISHLNKAVRQ
jgi:phosphonopyruvate decarboxylase